MCLVDATKLCTASSQEPRCPKGVPGPAQGSLENNRSLSLEAVGRRFSSPGVSQLPPCLPISSAQSSRASCPLVRCVESYSHISVCSGADVLSQRHLMARGQQQQPDLKPALSPYSVSRPSPLGIRQGWPGPKPGHASCHNGDLHYANNS